MTFEKNISAPKYLASLDLEMNQPSGKIIQIGCCVGNQETGEIVGRFCQNVKIDEPLNPDIIKLTGIREEDLQYAEDIQNGYTSLKEFLQQYGNERALNPLTWGGGDSDTLRQDLKLDDERWIFGRRWIDVKTMFTVWRWANGKPGDGGLANSMKKLNIVFQGRKHNALDDAINTFRIYIELKKKISE